MGSNVARAAATTSWTLESSQISAHTRKHNMDHQMSSFTTETPHHKGPSATIQSRTGPLHMSDEGVLRDPKTLHPVPCNAISLQQKLQMTLDDPCRAGEYVNGFRRKSSHFKKLSQPVSIHNGTWFSLRWCVLLNV